MNIKKKEKLRERVLAIIDDLPYDYAQQLFQMFPEMEEERWTVYNVVNLRSTDEKVIEKLEKLAERERQKKQDQ